MDKDQFSDAVEALVEEQYGIQDGGDLCYNLIEAGEIDPAKDSIESAAQMVAQRIEQA